MRLRGDGCRACAETTSGDCGGHGRITIPDVNPPTALTPEEQDTLKYHLLADPDSLLAIIRRLDAEIARLDALVRHAEADCVILRDRAVEASREGMEFLHQRDTLARALEAHQCARRGAVWCSAHQQYHSADIDAALAQVRGSGEEKR